MQGISHNVRKKKILKRESNLGFYPTSVFSFLSTLGNPVLSYKCCLKCPCEGNDNLPTLGGWLPVLPHEIPCLPISSQIFSLKNWRLGKIFSDDQYLENLPALYGCPWGGTHLISCDNSATLPGEPKNFWQENNCQMKIFANISHRGRTRPKNIVRKNICKCCICWILFVPLLAK